MGTEDMLKLSACMGTEDMLKLRACMGTGHTVRLPQQQWAILSEQGGHYKLIWLKIMMPQMATQRVRRCKVPSTAIGQISPGVGTFRAVRLPPARKMAMSSGALPEISRLMTSW